MTVETVMADAAELEALLVSRSYLYTLFHKAFGGVPNEDLLAFLSSQTSLDTVEEYASDNDSMAGFAKFLRGLGENGRTELLDRAKGEYTHLFIGPAELPASPYESPYTGQHDMSLFQENTLVVRRIYEGQGLRPQRVQSVPDDHISLMCGFMSILGDGALRAFQDGDCAEVTRILRLQRSFVENHLANWLGTYAKAVRNSRVGASAVLYPQMLEAAAAFVESDEVFCQEATYWAETVNEDFASSLRFPEVEAALEQLWALDLVGLRDNTLVALQG